ARLLGGKIVVLLYDSDRTKEHNGVVSGPPGWVGMKRVSELLAVSSEPPSEIHCVHWGPDGFDPERKQGWDVRDELTQQHVGFDGLENRIKNLAGLIQRIKPIPESWVEGRGKAARSSGGTVIEC